MQASKLPTNVETLFASLLAEHRFRICEPERSGSFDQMCQRAESDNLSVRFVRDRGEEFLEIGHGGEWYSTDLVQFTLLGGEPTGKPSDIQEDASFVNAHFNEIEALFNPQNLTNTLQRLHDIRAKKIRIMFPNALVQDCE